MVKTRKGKKGNKDDIEDENEIDLPEQNESEVNTKQSFKDKKKSIKKKERENDDDGIDDETSIIDNNSIEDSSETKLTGATKAPRKKKKGKKGADYEEESLDSFMENEARSSKTNLNKKNKGKFDDSDEDDDNDIEINVKSKKGNKVHSVFQFLDVEEPEDIEVDNSDDDASKKEDEKIQTNVSAPSKKEKSKGKKKKKPIADEEDEIERMLAELELEYTGDKSKKDDKVKVDESVEGENKAEETTESKKKKKKKKEKSQEETEVVTKPSESLPGGEGGEELVIKSAAQKKKEKKERDRLKKLEQNAKERTKQEKLEKIEKEIEKVEDVSKATPEPVDKEDGDKEEEEEEVDDKKKKKKKKDAGKEKDDKKRPGKKQVLLMQEALKKLKSEEEKIRLEEEAKVLAEQQAEELRLEKLRIEKERKEKKKQKEKERRERLKAEGKMLTKTQKQQRARAEATIEALKAQGFDVPSIGEKREKTFRPGTRIRPNKNKFQKQESVSEIESSTQEDKVGKDVSKEEITSDGTTLSTAPTVIEPIKDSWDISSDEEEKENEKLKQVQIEITDEKVPVKTEIEENHEEESDDQSGSHSEESSDEGEDGGSDSESESEGSESDDSDSSSIDDEEVEQKSIALKIKEKAIVRIRKRREENEKNRSITDLRSPIVCVLGHVDTGKTKILDKIRRTHVQDNEAGGITQQIGATMVPLDAIKEQAKMVKNFSQLELKIPGLLIIDTPGHESFSNLRSRGSSLCDIAILVVDLMHGLEPQTIESINLLKAKKTPFIVALNKIDRLYDWKVTPKKDVKDVITGQNRNTQMEFNQRTKEIIVQFAEQGLNAELYYDNKDPRTYVSMVPTSAATGEGMGNLLSLVVELTQSMLAKRLAFSEELQATVLELKAIPGLGTTIDIILVNGRLREGDTIVLAGMDGPVVTQIRSLLMPQPMKELRVKNPYEEFKEVKAAQGIKLTAKDLEKAVAGLNVMVAHQPDEIEIYKELVSREFHAAMSSIKLAERGVYVQASTLGSLEALLEFLKASKIPYSGIRIGPVVKRDVMKASIMLEHDSQYAVILAFDVKIERDAQELADSLGVKIFSADIIYHLFDRFTEYREQLKLQKRNEFKHIAVFPCKLRILPQFIFNTRDPIVVGVSVEAGVVREGTPICVPSQEFLDIGIVTTIEVNHKTIDAARKGQEVCIKIEPIGGDAPKLYGRHFDYNDLLVSKITRESIDACKNYFRDDLQKNDWQLMIELKKQFQIL